MDEIDKFIDEKEILKNSLMIACKRLVGGDSLFLPNDKDIRVQELYNEIYKIAKQQIIAKIIFCLK